MPPPNPTAYLESLLKAATWEADPDSKLGPCLQSVVLQGDPALQALQSRSRRRGVIRGAWFREGGRRMACSHRSHSLI